MVKNVLKKNEKRRKNNKGFSLVELIVVIAIMAVLVGVLAPQLIRYVEKSREATDIQNCDSIATTLKTYYSDKEKSGTITIKLTNGAVASYADTEVKNAVTDAGLDTKLKGTGWNENNKTGIEIKYDCATGKTTYTCESKYYVADNAETISPK